MEYADKGDTVYLHAAFNDTAGSGGIAAGADATVRQCGALASAVPITAGVTISLLSNAGYPDGCYEIAIDTSDAAYSADNTYAVFVTGLIDSQNPTGFAGKFRLKDAMRANWESYFNNDSSPTNSEVEMVNNIQQALAIVQGDVLNGNITATVDDAVAAPTTTAFRVPAGSLANRNDEYKGLIVQFVTGALSGVARGISAYNQANDEFQFNGADSDAIDGAWPVAPADGDQFIITGRYGQ